MTHPTPPKRYGIEVFIETNGAANYETVSQENGPFMFSHEALTAIKQARLDALEEAAVWVENNSIWHGPNGEYIEPCAPQHQIKLSEYIRKLKEGV